jgi:NADPH:quinone reductase-like Zn-dependent oxidoreductase
MKAVISAQYGSPDILEIQNVQKPEPDAGEVLVRVHATTVTRTDSGLLRAEPFLARLFLGLFRPKFTTLGLDFAGEVEKVGAKVTAFKPGDHVFGMSPEHYGAHAEYLCVPETGTIATIPADLSFKEAVVSEGAWYADSTLQAFGLNRGHSILIYGASGAIGTAAVQLAKYYGADVTAVVATQHLDLVRSLGADQAIDYTDRDFTQIGETFDFVFDAVGKTTYFQCRRLLKPNGVFASSDVGPWWQNPLLAAWSSITQSNRVFFTLPKDPAGLVEFLKARMEAKEFRAVIDRVYPLEAISDAYRYVETGQKVGIVVISLSPAVECTCA